MSQSNEIEPSIARALPTLRLIENGDHWLATPPNAAASGETTRPLSPFVLPRIPESLVHWLTIGGEAVWSRRQRCVAALLVLGIRSGRWTTRLPSQRCGPDAACWAALRDPLPGLPDDACLGGSYQTRVIGRGEHPSDTVPAVPGVHLVHCVGQADGRRPLWTFVRAGETLRPVCPDRIIVNDWADAVDEAMPRLRLA